MRTELTAEQINSYRTNGFITINDFLSPQELSLWKSTVENCIEKRNGSILPHGRPQGVQFEIPDPRKTKKKGALKEFFRSIRGKKEKAKKGQRKPSVLREYNNLWEDFPEYRELILDERIGKMAAELEGVDCIKIWNDKVLFKPAWGNPTVWHSDVPYYSYDSLHSPTFWIALEDANIKNGCLFYLPGTHKMQPFKPVRLNMHVGTYFESFPEFKEIEPYAVELKAGSCSIHNALIVHGAAANMTPKERKAINFTYIPGDTTYNGKKCYYLPSAKFDSMKIGEVFDDEFNPVVYNASKL